MGCSRNEKTNLLNQGIKSLPDKLEGATWLNYIRCHDDIGLGFDDADIRLAGYDPKPHRRFIIDYFTGAFDDSSARGLPFGQNGKTGDARISGSLASLVGLEAALESKDEQAIDLTIKHILLLHSMILSFGGLPLLYYGDEIGTLNDRSYLADLSRMNDSRWAHRPIIDWEKAALRHTPGSIENRIFSSLKKMIATRKTIREFADFNNRQLHDPENDHLFVFSRYNPRTGKCILVVGNFDTSPQHLDLSALTHKPRKEYAQIIDLYSGERPALFGDELVVPPLAFYWLTGEACDRRNISRG